MHERTFACAIAGNEGYFLASVDAETDVPEKDFFAVCF